MASRRSSVTTRRAWSWRPAQDVTLFSPGDEVYYAGTINRPGTDAQFHLVDERIVGPQAPQPDLRPGRRAAADHHHRVGVLFDRFRLNPESSGVLLVLGATGGVGSMVTQLARALTRMVIIGTASRPESSDGCSTTARTT